jgi:hypothetical protein
MKGRQKNIFSTSKRKKDERKDRLNDKLKNKSKRIGLKASKRKWRACKQEVLSQKCKN